MLGFSSEFKFKFIRKPGKKDSYVKALTIRSKKQQYVYIQVGISGRIKTNITETDYRSINTRLFLNNINFEFDKT